MIAYKKIWLANLLLQQKVENDHSAGYIIADELKAIKEKYPVGFYSPGLFARIGLFILTCIIMLFVSGLIALMASSSNILESGGFPIFLGLISYAALELMVNGKNHYRSGVDDALLFISGCLFAAGFAMILLYHVDGNKDYIPLSGLIFIITLYFSARFADMLAAVVCCIAFLAFIFFGWTTIVPSGLATAPFIMMLVSAGLYWFSLSRIRDVIFINYQNCLIVAQFISLLALYAAGNYYIIQTLSDQMHGITESTRNSIPFGAFFWAWTILVPFIYIGFGIKRKDSIILRTGLLLVAAAATTFRNYYHILPADVALTLVGSVLLGVAYSVMKYVKTPKNGFTYAGPEQANSLDNLKIESLIIAETFSTARAAPADDGVKFGGGDFGGGGSSSTF